jgi:sugar phosphate isomerase/epimerase
MHYTRRDLGKWTLAALPALRLAAQPNSQFGGVRVGIIAPYSFRAMPNSNDAGELLKNIVELGLGAVEMQSPPVEAFAGAPAVAGSRGGRGQMTPEQQAAQRAAAEELRKWRLAVSMDKFKALRQKYDAAGVTMDLVKFPLNGDMPDDEIDYCFQAAKALGCRGITCEPPLSHTKRLGAFAERHRILLGYHGHANVTSPEAFARPESWETAMSHSKYNGANIDIGHFVAGNSFSPIAFIKKHHRRITNLHLKDRKIHQGPNVPWGQGDTPIREVLQLMKKERYGFMATIELEYPVPEGSSVMAELARCVRFCREALA